jgi:homoserine kinase type II
MDAEALALLVTHWPIGAIQAVVQPATGSIHQTWLLTTSTGRFALRRYRYAVAEPIVREHALIAYAHQHQLPVVLPIKTRAGETFLLDSGQYIALFPFAAGQQYSRDMLTTTMCAAMGHILARIHQVLHGYPLDQVNHRSFRVTSESTMVAIEQWIAYIHALPNQYESDLHTLKRLQGQRAWIERHPSADSQMIESLPQQVIHGDYTETNLFFTADRVSGIIDWDQAFGAARAWELIRTIDIAFRFQPAASRAFLRAYTAHYPLASADIDIAAYAYATMRAHDLWMYEALYLEGNQRIRQFFGSEGFVPRDEQWQLLRAHLAL